MVSEQPKPSCCLRSVAPQLLALATAAALAILALVLMRDVPERTPRAPAPQEVPLTPKPQPGVPLLMRLRAL